MFEIRRLEADEMVQYDKMRSVVYNFRQDFSKEKDKKPDPLANPPEWTRGVFNGKKLLAGMTELDFLMSFDGHKTKMSGICAVGTFPEERMSGHIRRIFGQLLPEAYEKGVVFSNLTPFAHEFYRKFGYETACARNNISLNTRDFLALKPTGEFTQILPGDDTSALAKIHSAYIANLNHGIYRDHWPDNRAWKVFTRDDPFTTGMYLYLWRDEKGTPRSYIKFQDVAENGGHNMQVWELAFTDMKGLYGALGIVGGLSAQFAKFKWVMPTFIDPFDFVGDAWSVGAEIKPRDMTRVVNVETALGLMRRPAGEGAYAVEVADENIPANNGKWLVEYEACAAGGLRKSHVSRTKKSADISCDIRVLSQLITGYRSLENAMITRKSGLEVRKNIETLKNVFTLRPQHVTEYF